MDSRSDHNNGNNTPLSTPLSYMSRLCKTI